MVQDLSSVDVYFLLRELKSLVSYKLDKVYQDKDVLFFRFNSKDGKKVLKFVPGCMFFISEGFDAPESPPEFCSVLRRHLSGAVVRDVFQKGFERIIVFEFVYRDESFSLIFELFKPGNVVLVKNGLISDSLLRKRFKDRLIAPNKEYFFPPEQFNFSSPKDLFSKIIESDKILVKALAGLGLGGVWAEEVILRAHLDKNSKHVSEEDVIKLKNSLKDLFSENIRPCVFNGKVFPVNMFSFGGSSFDGSFSEALEKFSPVEVVVEKKSKYEDVLDSQKKRIVELEKEIVENQMKGDFIYEHYQEFSSLLSKISVLRKSRSFEDIDFLLKSNRKFKEFNKKEKKLVFEF